MKFREVKNVKTAIVLALSLTVAPVAMAADLVVTVTGADPSQGTISASLFDSEEGFLETPFAEVSAPVDASGGAVFTFEGLVAGDYAASAFHDANDSGDMDKGMFGIPKEKFGFSNDAKGQMGPPSYADAKFSLGEEGGAVKVTVAPFN